MSTIAKKIIPLMDRVLVRRIKPVEKTASGIYIPDSAKKELNRGEVLSVGPGALDKEGKRIPMNVTAGDVVILPTFSGTSIKGPEKEDEELFIYRDSELLAKVETN